MIFDQSMKKLKFDQRLLEFQLANGIISKKEYDEYLKSLEDVAHNAQPLLSESNEKSGEQH
jgi:hypothetical protein